MDNSERYLSNCDNAREIGKMFGLRLNSFDPNWSFESINNEDGSQLYVGSMNPIGCQVTDDMMGKLALLIGYKWTFVSSDEKIEKEINHCNLVSKELSERDKLMSKILDQDIDTNNFFIKEQEKERDRLENILLIRRNIVSLSLHQLKSELKVV